MNKRRIVTWLGLISLAAVLVAGFLAVLDRRFAEGGVYAHYASFRSDPLGVSVFYESLASIPGIEVSRNQTHLNRIGGLDSDTVLLLLGYPRDGADDLRAPKDSPVMEAVEQGARLVITFNPGLVPEKFRPVESEEEKDWFERREELRKKRIREQNRKDDDNASEDDADDGDKEGAGEEEFDEAMTAALGPRLQEKLGFDLESPEEFERPEEGWELVPGEGADQGPDSGAKPGAFPNWFSQFRFKIEDSAWRVVARDDHGPALIERPWGNGSIVLASDSYFVSNEALHRDAYPELLLWTLGGKTRVVFDETIHGVQETGGAMKLMRRYRVHGVFFGLIVVVVLWAWRSGSTLAPGSEELDRGLVAEGGHVAGENTDAGLVRLLRRSVPSSELFDHCFRIWKETRKRVSPEQSRAAERILDRHQSDPRGFPATKAYREMMELLRRR